MVLAAGLGPSLGLGCQASPATPDEAETEAESESSETGDSDSGEPNDTAPTAPTLVSPIDGAMDIPLSAELCWTPATDPEGDSLGYRVWVDEVELANGKTGDYGFLGPCTGPLDFVAARTFSWRVRAFELDHPGEPDHESPDSETWTFTTIDDDAGVILLADDFSSDRGWTSTGTASSGAWVHGLPAVVYDVDSALAQPGACFSGDGCFYTGPNPNGQLGEADVDGGSVVLTSPAFDASGVTSISVSLARFFYRSNLVPTGVSLELELVVPDRNAPGGELVHVLDKLDGGPAAEPANAWEPVEFVGCGLTLGPETRLRIRASDLVVPEAVIVEAAIDAVVIEGFADTDLCAPGVGALCDPDAPELACGPELACCAEGPVFDGVYRCEQPVASLGDSPPATAGDPFTGPLGCHAPDLAVLDWNLDVYGQNLFVAPDSCTVYEGCVNGVGWRRVLRFDTKTANLGSRDLVLGVPANHPDLYTYSACHEHHHFDNYANYTLLDANAEPVAVGHKQAFCLLDAEPYAWPDASDEPWYTCFNQGLSVGWSDTYDATLDCQWIDVTDVAPGDYTLRMDVNLPPAGLAHSTLVERDYSNNTLEIPVTLD